MFEEKLIPALEESSLVFRSLYVDSFCFACERIFARLVLPCPLLKRSEQEVALAPHGAYAAPPGFSRS